MAGGASESDDGITGINVTPLVDVTLVLLIIFMVTAQMITKHEAVQLNLPKAATGSDVAQEVFSVVLTKDGATMVNSLPVPSDDAVLGLAKEAHGKDANTKAVIKADIEVSHGRVMRVLDLIKQAKFDKIGFGSVQPGK